MSKCAFIPGRQSTHSASILAFRSLPMLIYHHSRGDFSSDQREQTRCCSRVYDEPIVFSLRGVLVDDWFTESLTHDLELTRYRKWMKRADEGIAGPRMTAFECVLFFNREEKGR